jgi:hypothetical protein
MQDDGTVGPPGEKRAGAEIGVSGVAAENVPSGGQSDELQDLGTGRLMPVAVGDLAASNTATAPSRVKVSPRIARHAAGEALG